MKRIKKLLATVLTLAILLSMAPAALGAWYDEAIAYVTENDLMDVVDDPDASAARGVIVDAIWRMAGRPEAESAAAWAAAQGILTGYDGDYHLSDLVTREQLATMLWRYAGETAASLPACNDAGSVASYAAVAVAWAQNAKVMSGVGEGNFDPRGNVTYAQLAQILMNYPDRTDTSPKVPTPETPYRSGALSIAKQGLFSSGGTVTDPVPGEYNSQMNWLDTSRTGNTAHVDHANVFYQIPETASGSPIVYLHGYGQSRMGWQTTPDGREGWSDIFLRYGHAAFLVDQPHRGEAGSAVSMTNDGFLDAWAADSKDYKPGDQAWYTHFRIGRVAPELYAGSAFPSGDAAQNQFFRQMTPNTGASNGTETPALTAVLADVKEMTGEKSIFITHSAGGAIGWNVDMDNVAAIIAVEPGGAPQVGSEQYNKLLAAKVPILFYFGDYIDNGPADIMSTGFWRGIRDGAIAFAEQYNADGGDATVIDLPQLGLYGNSHFLFQELNNKRIADHAQAWLEARGL